MTRTVTDSPAIGAAGSVHHRTRRRAGSRYVQRLRLCTVLLCCVVVSGCIGKRGGAYFQNDGPPRFSRNLDKVKDAVPRKEPLAASGNGAYTALGQSFAPMKQARGFTQTGVASWYGKQFHGRRTSSGERYDMYKMTAAHPVLPLPSFVRVRNLDNGREAVVRVNDRGPFLNNRVIDLSYAAAHKLDFAKRGTARVHISVITPGETVAKTPVVDVQRPVSTAALPPVSPTPSALPGSRIYVQVGVFQQVANATTVKQQLLSLGYRSVELQSPAQTDSTSTPALYRVRVGPVADMETANALLSRLARDRMGAPRLIVESARRVDG